MNTHHPNVKKTNKRSFQLSAQPFSVEWKQWSEFFSLMQRLKNQINGKPTVRESSGEIITKDCPANLPFHKCLHWLYWALEHTQNDLLPTALSAEEKKISQIGKSEATRAPGTNANNVHQPETCCLPGHIHWKDMFKQIPNSALNFCFCFQMVSKAI